MLRYRYRNNTSVFVDPDKTRSSKNFPLTETQFSAVQISYNSADLIYPGLFLTLVGLCDDMYRIFIDM